MENKTPQTYSNLDLELIAMLSRIDPILVNIIKGVRSTLNDIDNLDRFYQAANSIRGLTDILIRSARDKLEKNLSKKALNKRQEYVLENLSNSFGKTLKQIPSEIKEKKSYENFLKEQFYSLNITIVKTFQCLPITTNHVLKSYFGDHKEIDVLPKPLRERVRKTIAIWHENHGYFVRICHYPNGLIESSVFLSKWEDIQKCLLSALTLFFEDANIIDQILKLDEPPND